ncbi:hypothetical protein LS684_09515 [Cytobacillus spongiae]|uniref:hypothetical protein n=1 Tax=Cytobacillus spongiae TaxID=2901381 RepID=UPI001F39A12C|nr:hypothetical protein [Cytobacillus spongiae]UII57635.1 hypothetical protein LS684_09515 [Cytobacillus spongiae]
MGFIKGLRTLGGTAKDKLSDLKLDAELKLMEWEVDEKVSKIKDQVKDKVSDLKMEAEIKIDELKEKRNLESDKRDHAVADAAVSEQPVVCEEEPEVEKRVFTFGTYQDLNVEKCVALFREALAYEDARLLSDNLLDYDFVKDFKMSRFMMDLTGYAELYENSFTLEDVARYGNETKNLAGDTFFDILAVKFGIKDYYQFQVNLKKATQNKVKNTLFSLTKDLVDEVTIGKFSEIEGDFVEQKYYRSRNNIFERYRESIKGLKPVKIDEIVGNFVYQLIVRDLEKDEFETSEEFQNRIVDTFHLRFSEVATKHIAEMYQAVKKSILTYNETKMRMMLYSSYFIYINERNFSLSTYDADREFFKLSDGFHTYTLPIPRESARNFKEKFSELTPVCHVVNGLNGKKIELEWAIAYHFQGQNYVTEPISKSM